MKGKKRNSAGQIIRKLEEAKAGSGLDVGQGYVEVVGVGKLLSPARLREAVTFLREEFTVSERRACRTAGQARSTQRMSRRAVKEEEWRLPAAIERLVKENPRYGCRRITSCLRLEGWRVNRKRVHRLWKREGYRVPKPQRKRRAKGNALNACDKRRAEFKNDVWTWDFIFDRLEDGRALKILMVTDEYTRESPAVAAGRAFSGEQVVEILRDIGVYRNGGFIY